MDGRCEKFKRPLSLLSSLSQLLLLLQEQISKGGKVGKLSGLLLRYDGL